MLNVFSAIKLLKIQSFGKFRLHRNQPHQLFICIGDGVTRVFFVVVTDVFVIVAGFFSFLFFFLKFTSNFIGKSSWPSPTDRPTDQPSKSILFVLSIPFLVAVAHFSSEICGFFYPWRISCDLKRNRSFDSFTC